MTRETWHVLLDCGHWHVEDVERDTGPPVRAHAYTQCPTCWERTNVRAVYLAPTR